MSARLTDEQRRLRAITEAQWQKTVCNLLDSYGWRWYHAPRPGVRKNNSFVTVKKGWPDLACVRGNRLVFLELKTQTGRTTPEQDAWLDALERADAEVYVLRPSDYGIAVKLLGPEEVAA